MSRLLILQKQTKQENLSQLHIIIYIMYVYIMYVCVYVYVDSHNNLAHVEW
jgi:hypothetical protein